MDTRSSVHPALLIYSQRLTLRGMDRGTVGVGAPLRACAREFSGFSHALTHHLCPSVPPYWVYVDPLELQVNAVMAVTAGRDNYGLSLPCPYPDPLSLPVGLTQFLSHRLLGLR